MSATITAHPHEAPVAWRVKNDFGHWYVTQDKALADTYRDTENKDVQPLYLAAQPPAAPVEMEACSICMGSGYSNHPDSGEICATCNGSGGVESDIVPRSEMLEALANQRRRMGAEYDALDAELKRVRQVAKEEIGSLSRSHEALVAALKAWDAYGGFDTWEDTSRKANAMAEAIRDALTLS